MQDLIIAGYIELAGDIITRAEKDRNNRPLERCEFPKTLIIKDGIVYTRKACNEIYLRCVKNFFKTDWFEGLCDLAGKDPFAIRRKYDFRKTNQRTKTI